MNSRGLGISCIVIIVRAHHIVAIEIRESVRIFLVCVPFNHTEEGLLITIAGRVRRSDYGEASCIIPQEVRNFQGSHVSNHGRAMVYKSYKGPIERIAPCMTRPVPCCTEGHSH